MRSIGTGLPRSSAGLAIFDSGRFTEEGQIELEHDAVPVVGRGLCKDREVMQEATGNTAAIVGFLAPLDARVMIANPPQLKAIARKRVRTGKVEASILAKLYASGFLPEVWVADDETQVLPRLVSECAELARSIRRMQGRVQAVRHDDRDAGNAGRLLGKGGRCWLPAAHFA